MLLCCVLQSGTGFLDTFIDLIYRVGTSSDTIWIIVFTAIFGIFIQLISISKGERAFRFMPWGGLRKHLGGRCCCHGSRGWSCFFDDYTSVAIRGMMTKLYDRQKLPRAMLSYITDATGSPLCILIPFGTWAVFYQSLFFQLCRGDKSRPRYGHVYKGYPADVLWLGGAYNLSSGRVPADKARWAQ